MIYVRSFRAYRFRPSHFHPDRPIVSNKPSKSIVADFSGFLTRESFPHFRTIGADAKLFRALRPKLWPKLPFLPSLPIRPSKR